MFCKCPQFRSVIFLIRVLRRKPNGECSFTPRWMVECYPHDITGDVNFGHLDIRWCLVSFWNYHSILEIL